MSLLNNCSWTKTDKCQFSIDCTQRDTIRLSSRAVSFRLRSPQNFPSMPQDYIILLARWKGLEEWTWQKHSIALIFIEFAVFFILLFTSVPSLASWRRYFAKQQRTLFVLRLLQSLSALACKPLKCMPMLTMKAAMQHCNVDRYCSFVDMEKDVFSLCCVNPIGNGNIVCLTC